MDFFPRKMHSINLITSLDIYKITSRIHHTTTMATRFSHNYYAARASTSADDPESSVPVIAGNNFLTSKEFIDNIQESKNKIIFHDSDYPAPVYFWSDEVDNIIMEYSLGAVTPCTGRNFREVLIDQWPKINVDKPINLFLSIKNYYNLIDSNYYRTRSSVDPVIDYSKNDIYQYQHMNTVDVAAKISPVEEVLIDFLEYMKYNHPSAKFRYHIDIFEECLRVDSLLSNVINNEINKTVLKIV